VFGERGGLKACWEYWGVVVTGEVWLLFEVAFDGV
jgi:hypothetical protein